MTGLDKIIAHINLDADNTVASIEEKSKAQAEKIINEAQSKAQSIRKTGETQALEKHQEIIDRAESAAEFEERKILLSAKQDIINSMVSNTLKSLKTLPEERYFEIIYKMLAKFSENRDGEIMLNTSDLNRLPADFTDKVSQVSKGNLTLSEKVADIDSGFVLVYGGVEVNCSFTSLFSHNSEKISDFVADLLFKEEL